MPITIYRVSRVGATRPDRIQVDTLMRHRQHLVVQSPQAGASSNDSRASLSSIFPPRIPRPLSLAAPPSAHQLVCDDNAQIKWYC